MKLGELRDQVQSLANAIGYLEPGLELSDEQSDAASQALDRLRTVLLSTRRGDEAAIWSTVRQAREGKVCAAQSFADLGGRLFCYCTRPRGHEGEHVARASDGQIVAAWT